MASFLWASAKVRNSGNRNKMKPGFRPPSETGVWQLPEPAWEHLDTLPTRRGHPCPSIPTPSRPRHPRAASKTSSPWRVLAGSAAGERGLQTVPRRLEADVSVYECHGLGTALLATSCPVPSGSHKPSWV